ncbi:MAG: NADH-quinone oxidoreductase subunit NuoD [Actinobacteria bacterium]|nr:NADH-quinone oxidoreductase subunit NuoD [Actinomycetota bacterium]MBK77311.1 NADH-quinone oxidoreductase subunit NuoD [Actinomycetota bacterium]MBK77488.1 NADH-quinone oxidoreductase subunit NuoD [Actinomycetota bacterium]|tara:strand:- start:1190 stop:2386 length:1197 start_codon:yes stop_codon:yes gene_type:complete
MATTMDPNNLPFLSEASVSVEIETEDMTLNIGPQHPSTHGVLRLVAKVNGEKIYNVEPVLGYMHRGYEKLAEVRTYPQVTTLVNRIDWVSGFANEIPFIAGAEKLMEIEVPERAQYIRLILTEMARISSHFVFNGAFPLEIGALTPLFLAMEDRERVLDLLESVTGGRFHPNFNRIGGVKPAAGAGPTTKKDIQDLPAGFYHDTKIAMEKVLEAVERFENLIGGNEVFKARTKNVGILTKEVAEEFGVSGPILRASGVPFDLRKYSDYLPYDNFDFDIPIGQNGDCYDRWYVRTAEMRESAKIILQAIDSMPSGPIQSKVPKVIKVPKGQTYVRAENPKGEMGYYIISEGGLGPYRLKIRTASFSNISILPVMLEGALLPDLIAIMGSLDFVLGDVDR